ncbi:putative membrane protein [Methanonatronarchaeum thermophilum]|uniref:Putative membrane protein n=1 Tax=Methanonatronarchaeum thermophilum TaxID=1927129 RepID=A0A1Y3GB24_9EURY|nr:hypothetical protein [Methanonatronarchaeum thermophilum]OUJ18609.1 putative membrane protein [Methanonatronarchaeum thermophilum]
MFDADHKKALKKTALPSVMGIVAGVVAYYIAAGPAGPLQREVFGLVAILFFMWIQQSVFPLIDIDTDDFGGKDWAFVGFMTITFAYITWSLILNL